MRIFDIIFGDKIIINDRFFGKVESERTRKKDLSKEIIWSFDFTIKPFKKDVNIILDGNYNGVNQEQKRELKHFIENWDNVYSIKLDEIIAKKKLKRFKNWRNDYFMEFICPSVESNKIGFEVTFETIDKNDSKYFGFDFLNRQIEWNE